MAIPLIEFGFVGGGNLLYSSKSNLLCRDHLQGNTHLLVLAEELILSKASLWWTGLEY